MNGERLLRRRDVEEMVGLGRSSIYEMMRNEKFPAAYQVTERAVRWRTSEVTEWLSKLPAR